MALVGLTLLPASLAENLTRPLVQAFSFTFG
jgi:hypothetical protein